MATITTPPDAPRPGPSAVALPRVASGHPVNSHTSTSAHPTVRMGCGHGRIACSWPSTRTVPSMRPWEQPVTIARTRCASESPSDCADER
jgi:hypothetical protein